MQHVQTVSHRIYRDPDLRHSMYEHAHSHSYPLDGDLFGMRNVSFDNEVSLYGYDPTKTIRKSQQWSKTSNQQLLY